MRVSSKRERFLDLPSKQPRAAAARGGCQARDAGSKASTRALRKWARSGFLASALVLAVSGCGEENRVTFDSKPEGATVWLGNQILGPAPQQVAIPDNLSIRVRLALPGYQDWERRFSPEELTAGKTYRVELRPRRLLSVWFRSNPSNAEVRVDGELRGRTPLLLGDLSPGVLSVVFSAAGRESVQRTVELTPDDDTRTVSVALSGLTEEIYRQRINDNPKDLGNYGDLAHYLVLHHRFDEAADAMGQGLRLYTRGEASDNAKRLLQELKRIPQEQFEYGTDEDVKQATEALATEIQELVDEHPKAREQIYRTLIQLLLKTGQRQKAVETTRQALIVHPNDGHLKNYAKRLGIELEKDDEK